MVNRIEYEYIPMRASGNTARALIAAMEYMHKTGANVLLVTRNHIEATHTMRSFVDRVLEAGYADQLEYNPSKLEVSLLTADGVRSLFFISEEKMRWGFPDSHRGLGITGIVEDLK